MNAPIQNEQHALAEQVYINEFYINRASKLATCESRAGKWPSPLLVLRKNIFLK